MDSFIPRIGGKRLLRKQILARFPEDTITRYIEPFGGAGWVLFSRDRHAPEEIFNDIDGELINLFRCVKNHCGELQKQMQWLLNSREVFDDALALKNIRGLTDIQRAALFFIVAKESYGADGRTYGASAKNLERVTEYFSKISHRLQTVKIEHRNYEDIIKIYDKTGALIYLDHPTMEQRNTTMAHSPSRIISIFVTCSRQLKAGLFYPIMTMILSGGCTKDLT